MASHDMGAGRVAGEFGHAIRENPMPVALIGAGIGWLLVAACAGSKASGHGHRHGHTQRHRHRAGAMRHGGGPDARTNATDGDGSEGVSDAARRTMDRTWTATSDRVSRLGEDMRARARHWSTAAGDRARQMGRRMGDMTEDRPLLLGAAGLVLGAALGTVLPRTRYEDRTVGETRDQLKHGVEEYGREQWDKAQQVAERTVETAREEAQRQGFTAGSAGTGTQQEEETGKGSGKATPKTPPEGATTVTPPGPAGGPRSTS